MSSRPRAVSVAYWLWLVAAVLLVLFGLLAVTTSSDEIRRQFVENGNDPASVDSFVLLLRGIGVGSLVVGIVVGLLAGPVRTGDPRFRRALVTLSGVFALLSMATVLLGLTPGVLLIVPILLVIAAVLVYRPGARDWFVHE